MKSISPTARAESYCRVSEGVKRNARSENNEVSVKQIGSSSLDDRFSRSKLQTTNLLRNPNPSIPAEARA
jgi:hypothetical protein